MSDHKQAQSHQNHPEQAKKDEFNITETSYKTSHAAVRKARRFALQGLYEWLMTDHRFEQSGQGEWKANAPHDIAARTRATNAMHTVHLGYYHEMMREIPVQIDDLNALIRQHLDRDLDKIDMVEHAVLLIGAYELKHSLHIPYKVVLDESMKLNTHFGATDAHKLINAVMDRLAAELRAVEVAADTAQLNKQANNKLSAKMPKVKVSGSKKSRSTISNRTSEDSTTDSITNSTPHTDAQTPKAEPKPRIGRKQRPTVTAVADTVDVATETTLSTDETISDNTTAVVSSDPSSDQSFQPSLDSNKQTAINVDNPEADLDLDADSGKV